jgi:hypothetical protein
MRKLCSVLSLASISLAHFPSRATASCDDPKLAIDWSDQSVVKGDGIFQRANENYPFETYTVAARDPSDTQRICFRYKIKNITPFSGSNEGLFKPIKSFRWKDVDIEFIDVNDVYDQVKTDFTNYSDLQISTSNVGAFENSVATTRTILTNEEIETAKSTGVRPISRYDVKDHFPTAAPALSGAHLPGTPVIPVPNETAKEIQPIVNRINTQDLHATITSSNQFDGRSHLLVTTVDLGGLSSKEVGLFIPTLPDKEGDR